MYVACEPSFRNVESDARPFAACVDYLRLCVVVGDVVSY